MNRSQQSGVALVITLLMLSLITFLAVSFLSLSRRERASVTVNAEQTDAQLAVDSALARAQAEFARRVVAKSNLFAYDMMVTTNFINPLGFNSGGTPNRLTNVSYTYASGVTLNANDQAQNIANLLYDPRPPVYVVTNETTRAQDFRFYHDLNQNGRFETNGWLFESNERGQGVGNLRQYFTGDPEWIGMLERPDLPHSGTNRFVARYCYIAVPAGKILDINYIHNQSKRRGADQGMPPASESFFRNQGFGSWEINLAAVLRDLNTNTWPPNSYIYATNLASPSSGNAFSDALDILRYRYGGDRRNLATPDRYFGAAAAKFRTDGIDNYADRGVPPATLTYPFMDRPAPNNISLPWPGSDNTNQFYDPGEFFGSGKVSTFFSTRLRSASTNFSSYNRYTYYRLLEQLGVDYAPTTQPKVHLNFVNEPANALTNLAEWVPTNFFRAAANRLLRDRGYNFGITNIPIYPTNFYTSGVHQMLQVAANIYDSTTNRVTLSNGQYPYFPTVFRPLFSRDNTGSNIVISGFTEVTNVDQQILNRRWRDLSLPVDRAALAADDNVYGQPIIIGAKKGFPNFNECSLETSVEVTRKIEVQASGDFTSPNRVIQSTNQMYVLGISNLFGIEAWNSYTQNFQRSVDILVTNRVSMALTNQNGQILWPPSGGPFVRFTTGNTNLNSWIGRQFIVPLATNLTFLSNSVYSSLQNPHFTDVRLTNQFEPTTGNPVPQWGLGITNRLQYMVIDRQTRRLLDFVNLDHLEGGMDLTRELIGRPNAAGESSAAGLMWRTNRDGIVYQVQASIGQLALAETDWRSVNAQVGNKEKEIDSFRVFLNLTPLYGNSAAQLQKAQTGIYRHQAPYTPTRKLLQMISWQANDPLVHYTLGDLFDPTPQNPIMVVKPPSLPPTNSNLGVMNPRYRPWGGNPTLKKPDQDENIQYKDSLVRSSDDWEFPTNKFPNIGWLGRVHRGTPWQTLYLKAGVPNPREWARWSGAIETHPTNDWKLLEGFTVAPNDNAARGLLSVNQTNVGAWSGVMSGVVVISNTIPNGALRANTTPVYTNVVIEPGSFQLRFMVDSIRLARGATNRPAQVFSTLGEVLSAPALTENSPFLNLTGNQRRWGINDAAYERLPEQILSLLKSDEPKLVVYAYGQSLKPAANSIITGGNYFNLCTNYQITGEVATKTVMHLEGTAANPRVVIDNYVVLPPEE